MTSFSRVLKYDNVQKSDSGKITCKAFKLNELGNYKNDVITTITILKGKTDMNVVVQCKYSILQ